MDPLYVKVTNQNEVAVFGESTQFEGVRGVSHGEWAGGVVGYNDNQSDIAGPGVYGDSTKGAGIRGVSRSASQAAVVGTNDNGVGIFGKGARLAGEFEGDVAISGSLSIAGVRFADVVARLASLEGRVAALERAQH